MSIYRTTIVVLLIIPLIGYASEEEQICLKYETQNGWSKYYKLTGYEYSASELNTAVGSINRFKIGHKYMVTFWGEGRATIVDLGMIGFNSIPIQGDDQYGRRWEVAPDYRCFSRQPSMPSNNYSNKRGYDNNTGSYGSGVRVLPSPTGGNRGLNVEVLPSPSGNVNPWDMMLNQ